MRAFTLALLVMGPIFAQTVAPTVITTAAGNGAHGYDGNTGQPAGGPIRFAGITSIARDSFGNWFLADYGNHRIRRLTPDFAVATTVAGTGGASLTPNTGKATDSSTELPLAIALAGDKLLYVQTDSAIASIDLDKEEYNLRIGNGTRLTDGPALDAFGAFGTSLAAHPDGRVFFATPFITTINTGRVRVFEPATNTVRNLTPNGVNGLFKGGLHVVLNRNLELYAVDGDAFNVFRINLTTGAATPVLSFRNPNIKRVSNVAEGPGSTLFIADAESHKVFRLNLEAAGAAAVQTIAGNGTRGIEGVDGPAIDAQLAGPHGLYWDQPSSRLYIGEEQSSRLLFVDADGVLKLAVGAAIPGFSGDDKPAPLHALQSRLGQVMGLTADDIGNLYTCEFGTNRIRKVNPATGTLSLVAGHALFNGLSTDLAVESYIGACRGHAYDSAAKALYFLEYTNLLKRIDTISGTISTVSTTTFNTGIQSLAIVRGNIVVAETGAHRLRMVTPQGVVTTIAGTGVSAGGNPQADTPAAESVISGPIALAAGTDGTIYFTTNQGIIRSLGADGIVRHIAGSTTLVNAGDGGPAKQATFARIERLSVDARKRIYIGIGNMIRVIDEQGNVNRFAGGTAAGFAGDGGNPLGALFRTIGGMTVDASGTLFVGDVVNNRIRRIGASTAASMFSITSGNGQRLDLGAQSRPLTVEVRNANGQPVSGAVITYRVENGELSANSATTGVNGTASVLVKAGPEVGPVRVVATQNGLGQLIFDLTAIAALSITEVVNSEGSDVSLAPGSRARIKIENTRGGDGALSISIGAIAAEILEGSAAGGSVLVAIPDTLDAGGVDVIAIEADRAPSSPLPITLEATAPRVLGCATAEDVLTCRVTGYGRTVDSIPAAQASATIDGVASDALSFQVKSPGVAELQIRIPADFLAAGVVERTLIVRVGNSATELRVNVGQ